MPHGPEADRTWLELELEDDFDEELEQEIDDCRLPPELQELLASHKRRSIDRKFYFAELIRLQSELVKLQDWVAHKGLKLVILFEGRDAAGKGGVIKRITQRVNPRNCRVVALPAPSDREKKQWYFQRYVPHLPAEGEIVLFDRSWYNRAGVEHVMGFCTEDEYKEFLRSCRSSSTCWCGQESFCSSIGCRSAMRSRRSVFMNAPRTRSSAGNSARWISSRATSGSSIQKPKTRCSCIPIPGTPLGSL